MKNVKIYECGYYMLEHKNGWNKIYCEVDCGYTLVEQFGGTFEEGIERTEYHQINNW